MKLQVAILFWFYKEPYICENRLKILRRYNKKIPIYGLYGGNPREANTYKLILDKYLDDFYIFNQEKDAKWKWLNGDLMISDWYSERGISLSWDTIIIVQWDMLLFGSVVKLFSMLKKDEILLSGLRPISELEQWSWISPDHPYRQEMYIPFLEHVKKNYNYKYEPLGCLFIVVCLPRNFLDNYSKVDYRELGFLEYRIPIYGQIFKNSFCIQHSFIPWWADIEPFKNDVVLRAVPLEISREVIIKNLINPRGSRIFHPFLQISPVSRTLWIIKTASIVLNKLQKYFKEKIMIQKT